MTFLRKLYFDCIIFYYNKSKKDNKKRENEKYYKATILEHEKSVNQNVFEKKTFYSEFHLGKKCNLFIYLDSSLNYSKFRK